MNMSRGLARRSGFCALLILLAGSILPGTAQALPSFARQTGLPCATCHVLAFGPALTPYGQQFKLNGYVQSSGQGPLLPLSGMLIGSFTNTAKGQPGGAAPHFASNDDLAVDQASVFYGGRIADHVGAFVQVTYNGIAQHLTWDNTDIRFADHGSIGGVPLVYGLSLNNNPTVQDLWNSTPAWSFPYQHSSLAPGPAAAPLLEGRLAQNVYGLTAYTMLDRRLYLEAGAYRSPSVRVLSMLGAKPDGASLVRGFAPYWRATYQRQFGRVYASMGTFGLAARLTPGGDAGAGTDHYTDLGFDSTFQWQIDSASALHGNATFLHEHQHLPASAALGLAANVGNDLDTLRLNLTYAWRQTLAAELGWFNIEGSTDAVLYAPAAISGSADGSPASRGFIYQLEYIPFGKADSFLRPWLNVRLALQYTQYLRFNGGTQNYDGNGRNAADNNTFYLFTWFEF